MSVWHLAIPFISSLQTCVITVDLFKNPYNFFFFLRNFANMFSACFLKRNSIWIQGTCRSTFLFEVGQSIEELLEFVKA